MLRIQDNIFYNYLKYTARNFSQGFNNVNFLEEEDYIIFKWNNSMILDTNFCIYKKESAKTPNLKLSSKLKENNVHNIIVSMENSDTDNSGEEFKIYLHKKKSKNVKFTILNDYKIEKFTYNNKIHIPKIRKYINYITEYIDNKSNKDFENFATALMLIQDGELFVLSNFDENIISLAIVSSFNILNEEFKIINFIVTKKELRGQGFAKSLFQYIIVNNSKTNLILNLDKNYLENTVKNLYFELIEKYTVKEI